MKTISFSKLLLPFIIACCSFCQGFSQVNNWVWMKGSNALNSSGFYNSIGVPSSVNVPSARYIGVNWTDSLGNLWTFGGSSYNNLGQLQFLNDLWRYNIATNTWTWMKGDQTINKYGVYGTKGISAAGNKPGSRKNSFGWTDKEGNLWLLGGYGFAATSYGYLTDLWKYTIATNQWTWVNGDTEFNVPGSYGIKGLEAASNKPGPRYGSASWGDNDGNFWLFGGYGMNAAGTYGLLNDLWKYNIATNQWTWISGTDTLNGLGKFGQLRTAAAGNEPSARNYTNSFAITNGKLWLFGGGCNKGDGYGWCNDLWSYNTATNLWTWESGDSAISQYGFYGDRGISSPLNKPGARSLQAGWKDKANNFWIFGGYGYTGSTLGHLNDLWMYDTHTHEWTWKKGDTIRNANGVYGLQGYAAEANTPGGREIPANWTDASGTFWLFGGYGYPENKLKPTGVMNDMWKFAPELILPSNLLSFSGQLQGTKTKLAWVTVNRYGISNYEVERSLNGSDFGQIGSLKSSSSNSYFYYDDISKLEAGNLYYRLKMVDKDSKYSYSSIVVIKRSENTVINVFHNDAISQLQLHFSKNINGKIMVTILDMAGKSVMQNAYPGSQYITSISTSAWQAGSYLAKVEYNGESSVRRFVILK